MMASSICSLILGATSEAALLNHPDFDIGKLNSLSKLIKRSLTLCGQVASVNTLIICHASDVIDCVLCLIVSLQLCKE